MNKVYFCKVIYLQNKLKFHILKNHFFYITLTFLLSCLIYSCANRGMGPQGGPKDEKPPKLAKSKPTLNQKNYTGKTIEIEFDEFIQVKDVYKNVVISPPQLKSPVMKVVGKKFFVELTDSLHKNTTYTIDFGNAVVDNNEENVLKDFSFAFSTGNEVDSLVITGILIDAQTLNPIAGSFAGIYSNLSDTAFAKTPFLRMTKTNEKGEFKIKNVKAGNYHVFGLTDLNDSYYFDVPSESVAFIDSLITPTIGNKADTLLKDSASVDTTSILKKEEKKLILFQFKEDTQKQYLAKSERKSQENLTLIFNAPLTNFPEIEPLNFDFENKFLLQSSAKKDTLVYWLTDTILMKKDTLNFILYYPKTDSIGNLVPTQDTLLLSFKQEVKNQPKKPNKKEKEVKIDYFTYTTNASKGAFEYYDFPLFKFGSPVKAFNLEKIHLQHQLKDTIWENVTYNFNRLDSIGMAYELYVDLKAGEKYKIELDSAALTSIYDKVTEKKSFNFKVRNLEEYSTLTMNVMPFDKRIVIQLLNDKDAVVMQQKADPEGTTFDYLNPGVYFVRLFIDENGNEKWDPGKYAEKRQPEKVYYFNKKLSLRANWEIEEDWNYLFLPVLGQKPVELIPKETPKQ